MNTLNKEIEIIDENGIWQLVKEGDRYAIRTCYVYEDHENYDTYRLPNDLVEAVFTNYMEPSSYPLEVVRSIFGSAHKLDAVPISADEKIALSFVNEYRLQTVTWERMLKGKIGQVYPRLAERKLIQKELPASCNPEDYHEIVLTAKGLYSFVLVNRLLEVVDQ